MTKLSVNINKIATLRNARGSGVPDLVGAALNIERFGAAGITVHPRPDERHITRNDVYELKRVMTTELNIEGYPDDRYMQMVLDVNPHQATLVPDPPGVLTSNAGWEVDKHRDFLLEVITVLKRAGIRTSIFIEANDDLIRSAALTGTDRIELYTQSYAEGYLVNKEQAIAPFISAANVANEMGLGINAGHDLSLVNLNYFHQNIPGLLEVSIGHALISDALYFGLENTVRLYNHKLL
ncbi:MAG: pyridoxine 5'-phosphate synthase [Flavobacteriales bacterium]|nr:pyridoxine 5'-phosphate synthase [Flavobacteriales bacterium]